MFQPFTLFIGMRYTKAKRRNNFISFISLVSMLGIALGVMALITVLSVMNGFEKEVKARILGMVSHITITDFDGPVQDWQSLANKISANNHVKGIAPYTEGQVMMVNGEKVTGALIRGVIPTEEPKVDEIDTSMKEGELVDLKPGEYGIVLGKELAHFLRLSVGEKVTVVTPQANMTPVGMIPRLKQFTVTGIYEVGMYEYDRTMAIIHIQDAGKLFRQDGGVTGVRLKLDNLFNSRLVKSELEKVVSINYWIGDWTRKHTNYFRAVKTEKAVMFIILMLIVAVAAFNIVSTLVMMVTDKLSDIAILRTLGASPNQIMQIFLVQGVMIGVVGTIIGVVLGVTLSLNIETIISAIEKAFNTQFLPPDLYYISSVPSDMHIDDVFKIMTISIVISIVATLYPAYRASRVQPAEALRYE